MIDIDFNFDCPIHKIEMEWDDVYEQWLCWRLDCPFHYPKENK